MNFDDFRNKINVIAQKLNSIENEELKKEILDCIEEDHKERKDLSLSEFLDEANYHCNRLCEALYNKEERKRVRTFIITREDWVMGPGISVESEKYISWKEEINCSLEEVEKMLEDKKDNIIDFIEK